MLGKVIQRDWKIFLIAASLCLMGAKCDEGNIKIYNVEATNEESRAGLVRRDKPDGDIPGKIVEVVTFADAHSKYGCMLWDDIREIMDRANTMSDKLEDYTGLY